MALLDENVRKLEGSKRQLALMLAASAVDAVFTVGQATALASALTSLWYGASLASQAVLLLMFLTCYVARQGVTWMRSILIGGFAQRTASTLRLQLTSSLFARAEQSNPATSDNDKNEAHGTGGTVTMLVEGVAQVETYLDIILPKTADLMVIPALLGAALLFFDITSGIICLALIPVIIFYLQMLGANSRDAAAAQHERFMRLTNHFADTLRGVATIKAAGKSKVFQQRVFQASESLRHASVKTLRSAFISSLALDLFRVFALAAVAILLGFRLMAGEAALFNALVVLIIIPELFGAVRRYSADFHASLDGRNQLAALLHAIKPNVNDAAEAPCETQGCRKTPQKCPPAVRLENASFTYQDAEGAHRVLRHLNLAFSGPCKIALVGESGSGKTTLANLFAGFSAPSEGRAEAMQANETILLTSDEWRRRVAYLPQNPHLFYGTIRQNVAFYRPDAPDEAVDAAIRQAGLARCLSEQGLNLDTIIGQGGRALSGGQAQRVAMARAFLADDRDVLVLDEPTAHLDIETELELKGDLLKLMEGRLVFLATHRPHWLNDMDAVVTLDQGHAEAHWNARNRTDSSLGNADAPHAEKAAGTKTDNPFRAGQEQQEQHAVRTANSVFACASDMPSRAGAVPSYSDDTSTCTNRTDCMNNPEPHSMPAKKRGTGRNLWRTDTWARPLIGAFKKPLAQALLLGVAAMLFSCGLMFTAGYLISCAAEQPFLGLYSLLIPLGLVQVFGVGKPFLSYQERLSSHNWVLRIVSQLRNKLFGQVASQGMSWGSSHRAGEALGLLVQDIGHIQDLHLRTFFPLIVACSLWLITSVLFFAVDPFFAPLVLIGLGILCVAFPAWSYRACTENRRQLRALTHLLYDRASDDVRGITDWILSGRRADFLQRVAEIDGKIETVTKKLRSFDLRRDFLAQTLFGLMALFVTVWAALHFGAIPQDPAASGIPGRPSDWMAAFVLGLFPLIEAFVPLPEAVVQASDHIESLHHLNELSEKPVQSKAAPIDTGKNPEGAESCAARSEHQAPSKRTKSPLDIVLEDVSFAHSGGTPVLEHVSLSIPQGQHIAVLGPSGQGKTTLLGLIRGDLAPCFGSVKIGGAETGFLAADDTICKLVSVISQETYLFNQTIFDNLALGDKTVTRQQAEEALHQVGLGALLKRLPCGLDTMVDEAGLRFSGGERHRMAIARVLLQGSPLVLLDEPMASLDPTTEEALLDTLLESLSDRTIVLVTHHLAGIERMDRVVFIEGGSVALDGTPDQLLAESDRFQRLYALDCRDACARSTMSPTHPSTIEGR